MLLKAGKVVNQQVLKINLLAMYELNFLMHFVGPMVQIHPEPISPAPEFLELLMQIRLQIEPLAVPSRVETSHVTPMRKL